MPKINKASVKMLERTNNAQQFNVADRLFSKQKEYDSKIS